MSIPLKCSRCLHELRVKEKYAGKRVKCPECSNPIQVPGEFGLAIDPPDFEPPRFGAEIPPVPEPPPFHAATAPTPAHEEPVWTTPEWDDADDEPPPEDPHLPFPDAPDPSAGSTRAPSSRIQISLGTVADFALDPHLMTYALQWAGAWVIVNGVSLLLGWLGLELVAVPLTLFSLWVCGAGVVTGVAYLASKKVATREAPPPSEGWDFFLRRWVSVLLGTIGVTLAVMIVEVLLLGAVWGISHIPYAGPYLGGILVIPAFLLVLFSLSLMFNLYLLPVAIAADDCTALQAFQTLRQLAIKNGFALYREYFNAIRTILPFGFFSLLLTAGALGAALSLCGGELLAAGEWFAADNLLRIVSASAILVTWMAFVTVFATVSFTLVYCERTTRAMVYQ